MLAQQLRLHSGFDSAVLRNARDITVYLPPDYGDERRRFPVLYLQDGQNLFDPRTSFGGTAWHVDETAQSLIRTGEIEPLIIVGVNNTGHNRVNEYTPTRGRREAGGQASLYGRFLIEELKPFIDSEYDTLRGREWTGIGGSSLGGLVSLHLGFQRPDVFGRVAALSPSFGGRAGRFCAKSAPSPGNRRSRSGST